MIYFLSVGLKFANGSSHLLWGKCGVVCGECVLPIPFVCAYLRHGEFCLGRTPFDQNNIPQSCRLVGLVSHDVKTTWFQAVISYEWSIKSYAPSPLLSTFCRVLTTCSPVRPSIKAGLVAPGDALQKHQFPLQAAKGWFADKPTVKKDARDIKRLLC